MNELWKRIEGLLTEVENGNFDKVSEVNVLLVMYNKAIKNQIEETSKALGRR